MIKILCVIGLLLGVSACSTPNVIVKTSTVPTVIISSPAPVSLLKPNIQVYNSDSIITLADQLKKSPNPNYTLYVMHYDDFEKLIESLNTIGTYIQAKQGEIDYYKEYVKSLNQSPK